MHATPDTVPGPRRPSPRLHRRAAARVPATRRALAAVLAVAAAMATADPDAAAAGVDPVRTTLFGGLAVEGYDVVAYFTEGRPVEGRPEFTHAWRGATFRFSTAGHRDLFAADPERYAPRFGGYCAWAVAHGYTAKIDPRAWDIVDGRLYLNYSLDVQARWRADRAALILRADAEWPKLLGDAKPKP